MKRPLSILLVLLAWPLTLSLLDTPLQAASLHAVSQEPAGPETKAKPADDEADKAKAAEKAAAKERESREEELAKARLELPHAEVEIRLAEMKASDDQRKAGLALAKAEHGLAAAEAAMKRFVGLSEPIARDEASLTVERAENRLVSEQQDLDGILRIYADEPEASAKEEIIRRHRMDVKFAEIALDLAQRKLRDKQAELEAQRAELQFKAVEARGTIEQARAALERGAIAGRLEVARKHDALTLLKAKSDKLVRKLEEGAK